MDQLPPDWRELHESFGFQRFAAIPLTCGGLPRGALLLFGGAANVMSSSSSVYMFGRHASGRTDQLGLSPMVLQVRLTVS